MMNHLKHAFALPGVIFSRIAARNSSLTRSAGTDAKDSTKPWTDLFIATSGCENSTEIKLTDKSYAKIIADYSRAIQARELNGGLKVSRAKGAIFSKTSFERLGRISSLVKKKNCCENTSPSLSTTSFCSPSVIPKKNSDNDSLDQMKKRAEWLNKIVIAHRAKRPIKNYGEEKNLSRPLVQRIEKSQIEKSQTKNSIKNSKNVGDYRNFKIKIENQTKRLAKNLTDDSKLLRNSDKGQNIKKLKNIADYTKPVMTKSPQKNAARNLKLAVESRDESDKVVYKSSVRNGISKKSVVNNILATVGPLQKCDNGPNRMLTEDHRNAVLGAVTKLPQVNLETNGKGDDKVGTAISKVKTPVSSELKKNPGDTLRPPKAFCVSSQGGSTGSVGQAGDSGSQGSRGGSSHPSTFFISKIQNVGSTEDTMSKSKVIPWWTTLESFRKSEKVPLNLTEARIGIPRLTVSSSKSKAFAVKNPGKSFGLKFIPSQSDSFRFIPKSVSAPIRTHSNQSEKSFQSRSM